GYVSLDQETTDMLTDAAQKMRNGMLQLQGEDYSRLLVYLDLPESGDETYAFTDTIAAVARQHYPEGKIYVVGNSTNAYEFQKSFARDNIVVGVMSILIVLVVLLFTFKSVAMPILLILVIQGAIWINFSVPVFTHVDLFFIAYLIVSSIQMGANIDYAIVIASRFTELRKTMDKKEAVIETMNFAFPTILTSGSILAASGFILGRISSEGTIVGIGESLGRGTLISIALVMFTLPQILLIGERFIEKTSFSMQAPLKKKQGSGIFTVDGLVRGEIRGRVTGLVKATVEGDIDLTMVSGPSEAEDRTGTGEKEESDEK
ncbi:MAG: MMPL family transporter, partial [Firmicutes bacterium]|nr:MMPL family transporter [Bacillota bacterium]